jgi:predicted lipoprotein
MKKLLFVLAVALSACNSASIEAPAVADSISVKAVDSLKVDSSKSIIDTTKK